MFQDQAVEGLGAVSRQFPAQGTVDITDVGGAFDDVTVVFLAADLLILARHVGGEFADNFLKNIFQSHQAFHVAILVHHYADTPFLLLKVEQLGVQRCRFRNEIGLAGFLHDGRLGHFFGGEEACRIA